MTITKEQAMTEDVFHDKDHRRWRRNGATKLWKTRPNDFRVPVKFGLYAYGYVDQSNASRFHLPGVEGPLGAC